MPGYDPAGTQPPFPGGGPGQPAHDQPPSLVTGQPPAPPYVPPLPSGYLPSAGGQARQPPGPPYGGPGSFPPPQRGQGRIWLIGVGIGLVATLLIVILAVALHSGSSSPGSGPAALHPTTGASQPPAPSPAPTPAGGTPGAVPAGVISGSSGLSASACPQTSSGPWKLVQPPAVCGLPMGQDLFDTARLDLDGAETQFSLGNFGSYSSTVSFAAQPSGSSAGSVYASIQVYGFTGRITDTGAAFRALEAGTGEKFYDVPPGPHGGSMQCAQEADYQIQECVFATSTTLGDIQFSFGDLKIPAGISADASAIAVRNAVEVHA